MLVRRSPSWGLMDSGKNKDLDPGLESNADILALPGGESYHLSEPWFFPFRSTGAMIITTAAPAGGTAGRVQRDHVSKHPTQCLAHSRCSAGPGFKSRLSLVICMPLGFTSLNLRIPLSRVGLILLTLHRVWTGIFKLTFTDNMLCLKGTFNALPVR